MFYNLIEPRSVAEITKLIEEEKHSRFNLYSELCTLFSAVYSLFVWASSTICWAMTLSRSLSLWMQSISPQ